MIKLKMKSDAILTEAAKISALLIVKLINMNILQAKKYCHMVKVE